MLPGSCAAAGRAYPAGMSEIAPGPIAPPTLDAEAQAISRALARVAPDATCAEDIVIEGVAPRRFLLALRARLAPGGLLRATPGGWALDIAAGPAAPPLWSDADLLIDRGAGPQFPTDEQAAACLRLADALALGLGLGRGHVFPVYENPARRAVEMESFCDLPTLSHEMVQARVAGLLDLGVPVGAVLGVQAAGGGRWAGYSPAMRWGKLLLSPLGDGLRARMPEEMDPAGPLGYGLILFRPLIEGVAVELPARLSAPALSALLPVLEAAAARLGTGVLIEGGGAAPGIDSLALDPLEAGFRLSLPPARAVRASGALLDRVQDVLAACGGRVVPGRRPLRITVGEGAFGAHRALLAAALRHPVLTRLAALTGVGAWSGARRLDEQPGAVAAAARALLTGPDQDDGRAALAALLEGTEFALDEATLTLHAGAADRRVQHIVCAAAAVGVDGVEPDWPLAACVLPAVLAADLAQLLAALAQRGIPIEAGPLLALIDARFPVLGQAEGAGVAVGLRRALVDRTLPGDWTVEAVEITVEGPGTLALAVRPGAWQAVPLAPWGAGRIGLVSVPTAPATCGPCAGLFPPPQLQLAVWRGAEVALARSIDAESGWRLSPLDAQGAPPPPVPPCGLGGIGIAIGL